MFGFEQTHHRNPSPSIQAPKQPPTCAISPHTQYALQLPQRVRQMKTQALTLLSPIVYTVAMSEKDIRKLELDNGTVPFDEWLSGLSDRRMEAAVDARLARVR